MKNFIKLVLLITTVVLLTKAVLYIIDCAYKTCSTKYIVTPVSKDYK